MAIWDPGHAREAFGLTLTEAQKAAIRAKLPPAPESPLRDRGISLLTIFTAATLLIVALGFTMALVMRPPPEQPATPAAEEPRK